MGEVSWRLVGDAEVLRQKPCWRLRCATARQSVTEPRDLVLVYVAKLDKFFALDGACAHVGTSLRLVCRVKSY